MNLNKGARPKIRSISDRPNKLATDPRKLTPKKTQGHKSFEAGLPNNCWGPGGKPMARGDSAARGQSTSEPSVTDARAPLVQKPQFFDDSDFSCPNRTGRLRREKQHEKTKSCPARIRRSGSTADDSNQKCIVDARTDPTMGNSENSTAAGRNNTKSQDNKTYKKANDYLYSAFLEKVRLKKGDIQDNKNIISRLKYLLSQINKLDPKFPLCKKDSSVTGAGSYYEKLKVGRPNEFDVMVSLNVSPDAFKLEYERDQVMEGYVKLKRAQVVSSMQDWLAFLTDDEKYLSPTKIRQRFFELFEEVTKSANDICVEEHGPAVQLTITDQITRRSKTAATGAIIAEVDVVLCIDFPTGWPQHAIVEKRGLSSSRLQTIKSKGFHVVPKTFDNEIEDLNKAVHWRVSFSRCEKELIYHVIACKQKEVIKLVKFLRERHELQLPGISSYYLKNVFLHQALVEKKLWDNSHFLKRVMDILSELLKALKEGKLCHFFNSRCNLLCKLPSEDRKKCVSTIERMLDALKSHEVEKIKEIV